MRIFLKAVAMQALIEDAIAIFAGIGGKALHEDERLACIILYNMIYGYLQQDCISSTELDKMLDLIER
jgi:hypothetical protein